MSSAVRAAFMEMSPRLALSNDGATAKPAPPQNALLTTPPSTLSAAPVVAEASGLAT